MSSFATVEKLYSKNVDLKKGDVEVIQEWLTKQSHLPRIDVIRNSRIDIHCVQGGMGQGDISGMNEDFKILKKFEIILFLHSCYYKVEPTKSCIDTFYTVRSMCPEFFTNRDPRTNPTETLNLLLYTPLPKLTPEGYKVIFAKLIDPDPDNYTFAGQVKAFDMATTLMLRQEGTLEGIVVVTDMKDVTFTHFTKLSVMHVKKFFYYLQDAMPVRIKGLHFLCIPSFMDKIVGLIKPFMKGELFQVLYLHTDKLDTLYKFVPKECLPKDYGGDMETIENLIKIQNKNILENAEYFIQEEKLIADESKRNGTPKSEGDVFGVEGTFKKLAID